MGTRGDHHYKSRGIPPPVLRQILRERIFAHRNSHSRQREQPCTVTLVPDLDLIADTSLPCLESGSFKFAGISLPPPRFAGAYERRVQEPDYSCWPSARVESDLYMCWFPSLSWFEPIDYLYFSPKGSSYLLLFLSHPSLFSDRA